MKGRILAAWVVARVGAGPVADRLCYETRGGLVHVARYPTAEACNADNFDWIGTSRSKGRYEVVPVGEAVVRRFEGEMNEWRNPC